MPAYIVQPNPGTGASPSTVSGGAEGFVVFADSAASAISLCQAHGQFPSDASIAAATVTEVADAADLAGYRLRCHLYDPTTLVTVEDVTVTGVTVATIDTIAALMVIALNATTSIANAVYNAGTNVLTVAAIADALGDMALEVQFLPPTTANDPTVPILAGVGAIVDEGVAAADVTVTLNQIATPTVYAAGKLAS